MSIQTGDADGPVEYTYELRTNDPNHPTIKLYLNATINAIPRFVDRIDNADIAYGEQVGTFKVWPTAHPLVILERGEQLALSLRVRPGQPAAVGMVVTPPATDPAARPGPQARDVTPVTPGLNGSLAPQPGGNGYGSLPLLPSGGFSYKVRQEPSSYWLDLRLGPIAKAGSYCQPLTLPPSSGVLQELSLEFRVAVLEENVVVTPNTVDFGEVSLSEAPTAGASLVVRRQLRSIHIKALSANLALLKLNLQTIVEGRSYLIRIGINSAEGLKPGRYTGTIQVDTDDPAYPRFKIPCKVTLVRD